jgi:hypothetical protein
MWPWLYLVVKAVSLCGHLEVWQYRYLAKGRTKRGLTLGEPFGYEVDV